MLLSRKALPGLAVLSLILLPSVGGAQERDVVSKEISVGRSGASLSLDFADGGRLELSLADGAVLVGGGTVGSYSAGDPLDVAWRQLLGDAVALENGPLARMLRDWAPPSSLTGDALGLARQLDAALEEALSARSAALPSQPGTSLSVGGGLDAAMLRTLLGRDPAQLATLGEVLEGLGPELTLHVDEDVVVAAGEVISGSLVVLQGDVLVEGRVEGDVVVLDGTLELRDEGRVEGDILLAGGELHREGGSLGGSVRNLDHGRGDKEEEIRKQVREELRRELRRELRDPGAGGFFRPFGRIFSGLAGVIENIVAVFILGLVGVGVLAFAPRNLELVADTARRSPGRAAMVGVAGAFLLIPVWVLGLVALVVTIVGIPLAIAWIPLFPLAAIAAALLGYLAVARNVGEWLADHDYPYTAWISRSSSVTTILGGLVGLMALFMAANVLGIVPFFGFLKGLLTAVGVMASAAAMAIGFGAVLITRGGRQPEYVASDFDESWEPAVDLDDELDQAARAAGGGAEGADGGPHA